MEEQTRSPVSTGSGAVSERMQALLSRAAEDQLAEQRAVSASLNDLRNQVVEVAEAVRAGDSAGTVEQLRVELAGNASEVRRTYAQLSERLDTLAQRVDEVATSVAQGERRILAHVDEAVLALAEALLRRRRPGRPEPATTPAPGAASAEHFAEPGGHETVSVLARTLQGSGLGTDVLDIDELDRSIAAAEAEEAGDRPGTEDGDVAPQVYDNDADAEVPTDAPAGSSELSDGPGQTDEGAVDHPEQIDRAGDSTGQPGADDQEQAAEPDEPLGPAPAVSSGSRTGVTGGHAPRRARSAVPPLPPVMPGSEQGHDSEEDEDSRRRPWWRPGG